ncbi:Txe/YoeB family addiction module toxin [Nocardia cyriacigeorgica]|uniref:Txe/YoeB family addiction module toxin n=1 Tax=Nocardia cyriacigeorgica TaxID=135487 RepID=UPI00031122D4|nr:Txe/YoeB family addiction module toxin [Nocardia cyriacigeorgica]MBF6499067.1 Txe/YoeB family addiction module toxin [Nocardia cyriacigeorgica]TLF52911.1 Txe/YoeB family addiction module toxin [Nocardia cyriacigeorgica]
MSRTVTFTDTGWTDYLYWRHTDQAMLGKLNRMIDEIRSNGNAGGAGSPEPLRQNLSGWWSRRIDHEHRIVYRSDDDNVVVIAC